ncbi:unnamed protein product [Cuscuta europaea]|uniref:DDE Tnp4 domain-containing protein n=1 Tax=Cuscuta europaea TaxID=41803 RepID=A0A9P1E345_CUSEU|nr:unnamed protein product [Cuscuta europaea]
MKHSRARNIIDHAFGLLKNRWAILCSASWYSIRMTYQIIVVCALIHNFIRREHDIDPMEDDEIEEEEDVDEEEEDEPSRGLIKAYLSMDYISRRFSNKHVQHLDLIYYAR